MNQQKSLIRISELLTRFQVQVGILNANALLDINVIAQDTLIPIFKIVFDCPDLYNADHLIAKSFPAIDLIDEKKKVTFQITSTSKSAKIKNTLEKIVTHHSDKFDWKHYIYIITQKQDNYDNKMIELATEKKFAFDKSNILDASDLFKMIANLTFDKIKEIENYLELQFSDIKFNEQKLDNFIENLQSKLNNEALTLELEGIKKAKINWIKKKLFFEEKLPFVSGTAQEFQYVNEIETCTNKINEYNKKISFLLNQLTD